MPGLEHTSYEWYEELFLLLFLIGSVVTITVALIGLGGGIYWVIGRVRPANELVRVCMWCLVPYAAVAIVLVGGYWLDRLRYPI
jgi:hypothetical protein